MQNVCTFTDVKQKQRDMKAKDYQLYADIKKANNKAIWNDETTNGIGTDLQKALKKENEEIDATLADLPRICISCMVGYRTFYYDDVIQIGKTLYRGAEKVNKQNGYRVVEIIPEVTDRMRQDMIADSYHY